MDDKTEGRGEPELGMETHDSVNNSLPTNEPRKRSKRRKNATDDVNRGKKAKGLRNEDHTIQPVIEGDNMQRGERDVENEDTTSGAKGKVKGKKEAEIKEIHGNTGDSPLRDNPQKKGKRKLEATVEAMDETNEDENGGMKPSIGNEAEANKVVGKRKIERKEEEEEAILETQELCFLYQIGMAPRRRLSDALNRAATSQVDAMNRPLEPDCIRIRLIESFASSHPLKGPHAGAERLGKSMGNFLAWLKRLFKEKNFEWDTAQIMKQ